MIKPEIATWIIGVFGAITFLPLLSAQLIMLLKPNSQKSKDILIGKGEDWRDKTHFKSALAFAWADLLVIFPLFVLGSIGVFLCEPWGYVIWLVLGVLSIYFSILFWVMEREYTYTAVGWLVYYTYFWGFFLYWGIAAIVHAVLRLW